MTAIATKGVQPVAAAPKAPSLSELIALNEAAREGCRRARLALAAAFAPKGPPPVGKSLPTDALIPAPAPFMNTGGI